MTTVFKFGIFSNLSEAVAGENLCWNKIVFDQETQTYRPPYNFSQGSPVNQFLVMYHHPDQEDDRIAFYISSVLAEAALHDQELAAMIEQQYSYEEMQDFGWFPEVEP